MKQNKAAMELSVGTIVIIVLAMTMLILGLLLIKNIFSGGQNAIDTINDQVTNEISKLFGEDKKLVIYPNVKVIEIRKGKEEGFAIGIKNKLPGSSGRNALFSYEITPYSDEQVEKDCGLTREELMDFFVSGSNRGEEIPIAQGDQELQLVLFNTGENPPLCTVRFKVDVKVNGNNYATTGVFVKFKG